MKSKFIFSVAILLLLPGVSQARGIEDWPYDKLSSAADLIVIAEFDSAKDIDVKPTAEYLKDLGDIVVGQISTLNVKAVLKGKITGQQIDVIHFSLKDHQIVQNGPLFFHFQKAHPGYLFRVERSPAKEQPHKLRQSPQMIQVGPMSLTYLLFLKRRADGRYEAVSGEVDPAQSCRTLDWTPVFSQNDDDEK